MLSHDLLLEFQHLWSMIIRDQKENSMNTTQIDTETNRYYTNGQVAKPLD